MLKQVLNKSILIIVVFVTVLSLGVVLSPQKVQAEEWPATGALCFNYQDVGYYSFVTCPTNDPAVKTNERNCYKKNASGAGGWESLNCGTVIQANTACARSKCYPDASITGIAGGKAPTSADSGNEEADRAGTISNADRDRYRNCNGAACLNDNPIIIWTKRIINFLAAGVGIVTTIMIIIGGIQYASAGPNPQAVASAKKKIVNAIIALLAYFFLYGFMQWLIPGGLF